MAKRKANGGRKPKSTRQRIKGYTRKDGTRVKGYLRKRKGSAKLPGAKFQPRAGEAPPESGVGGGYPERVSVFEDNPDWFDFADLDGMDQDADDSYAESEGD